MNSGKFKFMLTLLIIAIITCFVLWIMAIIGGMNLNNGCFYRYNFDSQGNLTNTDSITDTIVLKGSGNYIASDSDTENIIVDSNAYGKWLNSNLRAKTGQNIKFKITGEVSLCRAYIPPYNIQQDSDLDIDGDRVPIPRVNEMNMPPVSLIFDAQNENWSNLAELYRNDEYYASISRDQKTSAAITSQYDVFLKDNVTADCREGARQYQPICGRYSMWNGGYHYIVACVVNTECYGCNPHEVCDSFDVTGWCASGWRTAWDWCACNGGITSFLPEGYKNDGRFNHPWTDDLNDLWGVTTFNCTNHFDYINGAFQNERYSWFSADDAAALLTRIDNNIIPTARQNLGTGYNIAKILDDQSYYNNSFQYKIIDHNIYDAGDVAYLQYKIFDAGGYTDNTGGYVLNIRQTKCRRANGFGMNDVFQGRGWVEYVIVEYGQNPNEMTVPPVAEGIINVGSDGIGEITTPSNKKGYLWLRIKNDLEDYKDSVGQYNIEFSTEISHGNFFKDVLDPLFRELKLKIKDASITVFKNMTCYQGAGDADSCTNFFNYVKGLLILYIMFYGMMFLLGMVQITQTDLVIRAIKIGLVAGLMNEQTFEFFNDYVFDFTTGFSDNIIANMSGYAIVSGDNNTVSSPFIFMDEVFTKFFLSSTFAAQIMALLSMGINGFIYFLIIFVCIGIVIVAGFRSIAIYLMAYLAIAVLIGIAPLFLTFILFERTRYLFDNWVKFTFRYMIEPTIMLAGIIILTQLFTIYLDYVIGYSVCWKCAIPFKLPFPALPGFNPAFLDVDLFCINWFAPWGFDHRSSSMGLNMTNVVVLLMLAYCMWGWTEFAGKIVGRLAGAAGGPSATSMGMAMAGTIEEKALGSLGLDKETRGKIKGEIKQRLSSMNKGEGESSLKDSNRLDKPDSSSGGGSTNGGGGAGVPGGVKKSPTNLGGWGQAAKQQSAKTSASNTTEATRETSSNVSAKAMSSSKTHQNESVIGDINKPKESSVTEKKTAINKQNISEDRNINQSSDNSAYRNQAFRDNNVSASTDTDKQDQNQAQTQSIQEPKEVERGFSTKSAGLGKKKLTAEQKQKMAEKIKAESATKTIERKDNSKTDKMLKSGTEAIKQEDAADAPNNKSRAQFSTKSAGLGKKKLTAEQKQKMAENLKKRKAGKKIARKETTKIKKDSKDSKDSK